MEALNNEIKIKDISSCLMRVERSYRNLLQFKEKMSSYMCEPTTYNQYEAREKLCQKMEMLTKGHLELLNLLKSRTNDMGSELSRVKNQLFEVKNLEKGISNYLMSAYH